MIPVRLFISCLFVALAACSFVPERPSAPERIDGWSGAIGDAESVKRKLYSQYSSWKGTRYEIGGTSRKGVDCSGFVYVTFKSRFGVVLPRSTELQAEVGESVSRSRLRPGDLVFFKTGWFDRHVGIYLDHGKFLHASTSSGVTISELGDSYWNSAYWKARRVER